MESSFLIFWLLVLTSKGVGMWVLKAWVAELGVQSQLHEFKQLWGRVVY